MAYMTGYVGQVDGAAPNDGDGVVVADIVVDRGAAIDTEVSRSAGHLLGPAHAVGK